ncbi:hypothetical protein HanIR_Chr10g0469101 [Helianthus annuus]|nr:hypothetical protein HanIR_Chr10g0469101 [Helianthus annuus]
MNFSFNKCFLLSFTTRCCFSNLSSICGSMFYRNIQKWFSYNSNINILWRQINWFIDQSWWRFLLGNSLSCRFWCWRLCNFWSSPFLLDFYNFLPKISSLVVKRLHLFCF